MPSPSYKGGVSVYEVCLNSTLAAVDPSLASSDEALMSCIASTLQAERDADRANQANWFFILCGALVFSMQVGFAMLCAGCVRKKNVQNTMLKNLMDACGSAVAFYALGFGLAFGGQNSTVGNTFVGTSNFFLTGEVNPAFWFYEYAFSATSATIVAGAIAERCQMIAYLCYSVFLTAFVYPVVAHAVWSQNGFLSVTSSAPLFGCGVLDFAGSGVVHVTGGSVSLIAVLILGARQGRFTDARGRALEEPAPMPGHSIALQLLGTMLLWFSWYGFNPGSALLLDNASSTGAVAALAAANTSLSAAGGVIASLFANLYYQERKTGEYNFDLTCAMNGALSGLVAITSGCAVLEYWAALVTGLTAGLVYLLASRALIKYRIDDACDAIPVHLFSGLWGLLLVGFFASPGRILTAYGPDSPVSNHAGIFYGGGGTLLGCQVVALLFIAGWAVAAMAPFFFWLHYFGWLRVDSLEERVGLDRSYHGEQRKADDEDDFLSRLDLKAYRRERKLRRQQKLSGLTPDEASVMSWNDLSYVETDPSRKSSEYAAHIKRHSTAEIDDDEASGME